MVNKTKPYQADPHERGPGRIHLVEDGEQKTVCGIPLNRCPGRFVGSDAVADCKKCPTMLTGRHEWELRDQQRRAERERERRAFFEQYSVYLKSESWRRRRQLVFERANGLCEGCAEHTARHVHHKTYEHVCNEFLWELVAVCERCHQAIHPHMKTPPQLRTYGDDQ